MELVKCHMQALDLFLVRGAGICTTNSRGAPDDSSLGFPLMLMELRHGSVISNAIRASAAKQG